MHRTLGTRGNFSLVSCYQGVVVLSAWLLPVKGVSQRPVMPGVRQSHVENNHNETIQAASYVFDDHCAWERVERFSIIVVSLDRDI